MSNTMNKDKLQALSNELAKDVKTPDDLSQLSAMLTKLTVEAASKKWTMPIRNWKPALNRFIIEFEEQLASHI